MLCLVPTPIGNLEDISKRSLRVLEEAELIFCEDTRVTKQLLNYFNIDKKLVGDIDVYDKFTFVEVGSEYADLVVENLSEKRIKGAKVRVELANPKQK